MVGRPGTTYIVVMLLSSVGTAHRYRFPKMTSYLLEKVYQSAVNKYLVASILAPELPQPKVCFPAIPCNNLIAIHKNAVCMNAFT